jgi:hypothetical protein
MRVALDRVVVARAMRAHRDEKSSSCASTSHSNVATPSRDGETRDDAPKATAQDDEVSIHFYASPARDVDDGAHAHGNMHSDDDDDDRPMPSETFDEDFKRRSSCVSLERRRACVPPATLALEYWTRDEATTEAKKKHIDALDRALGSYGVEEHIERTVLKDAGTVLEANMFPYACPPGVTHRTLWSRAPMDGDAIVEWVCAHLRENFPGVTAWNFDLNENNSVDVPHYHVFTYEAPTTQTKTKRDEKEDEGTQRRKAKKTRNTRWDEAPRTTSVSACMERSGDY